MPTQPKDPKTPKFEKALSDLEKIVEQMEEGDLNLENALKMFEKGITLTRQCQTALQQAEQKVKILIEDENTGKQILSDFDDIDA